MELRSEFRFWERKVERSEKRTKEYLALKKALKQKFSKHD